VLPRVGPTLQDLVHGGVETSCENDYPWDEEAGDNIPVAAHLIEASTYYQDQMYPGPRVPHIDQWGMTTRGKTFNGSVMRFVF
jgi:hypothetical protein